MEKPYYAGRQIEIRSPISEPEPIEEEEYSWAVTPKDYPEIADTLERAGFTAAAAIMRKKPKKGGGGK